MLGLKLELLKDQIVPRVQRKPTQNLTTLCSRGEEQLREYLYKFDMGIPKKPSTNGVGQPDRVNA